MKLSDLEQAVELTEQRECLVQARHAVNYGTELFVVASGGGVRHEISALLLPAALVESLDGLLTKEIAAIDHVLVELGIDITQ
jgi:hypothetical protein